MKINCIKMKLICLVLFLLINVCLAQTINLQTLPDTTNQLELRFDKPFYINNSEKTKSTEVYQLSLNIPISSEYNLISSIPYINTSYTVRDQYGKYQYEKLGFGNIFVGLQTNKKYTNNWRSIVSAGVFLPTAEEKVTLNGLYSNYCDIQKFLPNSIGLYFNYAYHRIVYDNFNFVVEAGPNLIIPTGDYNNYDMEVFLHYGFNAGYKANKLLFNVELLGMAVLTHDMYDFSYSMFYRQRGIEESFTDRFVHILNLGTQWKYAIFSTKLFYKIYLKEEINNIVNGVLGLGITVSID